jgi:glutaredoxin
MVNFRRKTLVATLFVACCVTIILLAIQVGSFAATDRATDKPILLTAQNAHSVELYITTWCPYCRKAIAFFQARGIPITVYDIERDAAAAQRKNELDRRRGVPFAVVNGKKIHGYSEAAYLRALNGQ